MVSSVINTAHDSYSVNCSFLDDIEVMLKWRPPVVYKYLWKYVCLLAMVGLLAASLLRMVIKGPTYTAWNQTAVRYCPLLIDGKSMFVVVFQTFPLSSSLQASEMTLEYPGWALAMIVILIILASSPVPIGYLHAKLRKRGPLDTRGEEGGGQEVHRELYTKCNSTELLDSRQQTPGEEGEAHPRTGFLPIGTEQYRLLPQQEEEDEEEDTGV